MNKFPLATTKEDEYEKDFKQILKVKEFYSLVKMAKNLDNLQLIVGKHYASKYFERLYKSFNKNLMSLMNSIQTLKYEDTPDYQTIYKYIDNLQMLYQTINN